MKRREHPGGFTLIELLLVVIIIGILAAIVVPRLTGRVKDVEEAQARANLKVLRSSLNLYQLDNGDYPTSEQGLEALITKPTPEPRRWKGPYLDEKQVPRDPWGNEFVYAFPGTENTEMFDLYSTGKDGQSGTEDDIDAYQVEEEGVTTE